MGHQSPSPGDPRVIAAVLEGNIMPTLYWYFPIIMFSCVCDLVASPYLANSTALRASSPTAPEVVPTGPTA
jgi:hypothetical protein